jgi:hypothetical protein
MADILDYYTTSLLLSSSEQHSNLSKTLKGPSLEITQGSHFNNRSSFKEGASREFFNFFLAAIF